MASNVCLLWFRLFTFQAGKKLRIAEVKNPLVCNKFSVCCIDAEKEGHGCCIIKFFKQQGCTFSRNIMREEVFHLCDKLTVLPAEWHRVSVAAPQSLQSRRSQPKCFRKLCHHQRLKTTGIRVKSLSSPSRYQSFHLQRQAFTF